MQIRRVMSLITLVLLLAACSSEMKPPVLPPEVEVIRDVTLTDDARVPQDDPSYAGVEIYDTRLVFLYSATPTITLEPGHVLVGSYGAGYLRRLVSVGALENGRLEVTTESAYITDVVRDGAFRVQTHPAASTWIEGDGMIGGRQSYLDTNFSIFSPNTDWGLTCGGAISADIAPIFDIDLDLEMMIDVREGEGFFDLPYLYNALFAITGSVEIGVEIKSDVALSASCSLDIIELLRDRLGNPKLFKMELPQIEFAAGPLPVVITHTIEPTFGIEGTIQADISPFEVRATATFGVRAGIEKINGGDWRGIWQPSRTASATLTVPNSIGSVSASVQAAAGVQYSAFAWDLVGPSFALQDTITGAISVDPNTCEWETTVTAGSDFVAGINLQVPIIDYSLASVSSTFNLASAQISRDTGVWSSLCEPDAGVVDAGPPADAGALDAPFPDASFPDASFPDASFPDAMGMADATQPLGLPLFWAENGTGTIRTLDGTGAPITIVSGLSTPIGIAVDRVAGKVYWNDQGTQKIQRANLDGSFVEDLATSVGFVRGMGIDTIAGRLYWTEALSDSLFRSNLDGSGALVIASFPGADLRMVAVDAVNGKVYVTVSGDGVWRGNLDGSGMTLIIADSNGSSGVAVDPGGGKVYFTNYVTDDVYRANLDGSGAETLVSAAGTTFWAISVDATSGHIYYTNQTSIRRADLGGANPIVLLSGLDNTRSVAFGN